MIQKDSPFTRRLLGVVLLIFIHCTGFTQQFSFSKEVQFAEYLQDKEAYKEAKYVLDQIDTTYLSPQQRDTLFYLTGWGAYLSKQLDTSVKYLLKVSPSHPLFQKSRFFAAYNMAYLGRPDPSKETLVNIPVADSIVKEMQRFQLAGVALLKRDYSSFEKYQRDFTYSFYAFEKEEHRLGTYHQKLSSYRHKSPLLAGIYSAVLPGAGKFYAGKKKQGIASFLPIASLGLVTYEAYRKGGAGSARFLAFGSLFSLFYVGNIWGSVLSVKIKQNEFYREYDNKILFDLHIPLRNLYN
jgi:hypothetical protein